MICPQEIPSGEGILLLIKEIAFTIPATASVKSNLSVKEVSVAKKRLRLPICISSVTS